MTSTTHWVFDSVGDAALPVVAFYLIVLCNFIREVMGCQIQTILDDSMWAKHIVAILLLFFLVVLARPEFADQRIIENVMISLAIYGWFWLTSRAHLYVTAIVLALLVASYLIGIAAERKRAEKEPSAEQSLRWRNGLAVAALFVSVLGSVAYIVEKRAEYGKAFDWTRFLSGNMKCRKYTPKAAKVISG